MNKRVLFSESQRFRQWWLWVVIFVCFVPPIFIFQSFAETDAMDSEMLTGLLIAVGVMLLLIVLMLMLRLDTQVNEDGISVRFYPIHLKYKHFPWREIEDVYVRTYSPISEFGGYGLRIGFGTRGSAYNVSGNKGLQIIFRNKKRLLIGTRKADELQAVIASQKEHHGL